MAFDVFFLESSSSSDLATFQQVTLLTCLSVYVVLARQPISIPTQHITGKPAYLAGGARIRVCLSTKRAHIVTLSSGVEGDVPSTPAARSASKPAARSHTVAVTNHSAFTQACNPAWERVNNPHEPRMALRVVSNLPMLRVRSFPGPKGSFPVFDADLRSPHGGEHGVKHGHSASEKALALPVVCNSPSVMGLAQPTWEAKLTQRLRGHLSPRNLHTANEFGRPRLCR